MNAKTSASILLGVVILAGVGFGLSLIMTGFELAGWLMVLAGIVCLVLLWMPRKRTGKS